MSACWGMKWTLSPNALILSQAGNDPLQTTQFFVLTGELKHPLDLNVSWLATFSCIAAATFKHTTSASFMPFKSNSILPPLLPLMFNFYQKPLSSFVHLISVSFPRPGYVKGNHTPDLLWRSLTTSNRWPLPVEKTLTQLFKLSFMSNSDVWRLLLKALLGLCDPVKLLLSGNVLSVYKPGSSLGHL